jgi:hypothetical protein
MAIINYPERVFKVNGSAIDAIIGRNLTKTYSYSKDLSATAIDNVFSVDRDWKLNSIILTFSGAVARDFSVAIANGRKVVANYNDFLWFEHVSACPQKITLTPGFYTGTDLATELETQLDANTEYTAAAITFTVAYDNAAGTFTITPSSGNIKYILRNLQQVLGQRDSIAGNLFGLNANGTSAATSVSDTLVVGLNDEGLIVNQAAYTDTYYNYLTPIYLSIDKALHFESSVAGVTMNIDVNYELTQQTT